MNAVTKTKAAPATGLDLLREPFPANQISKLPKPTKAQTEAVRADFKKGVRCKICGAWHHPDVVHLDYVGHAALTDRLLDCDINWNWEPVAFSADGTPAQDANGGMWIKLTVCGHTRLGYGHPDGKKGGDAIKEVIGDALRNAAMRFGAALDLWHKGDLHGDSDPGEVTETPSFDARAAADRIITKIHKCRSLDDLRECWTSEGEVILEIKDADASISAEVERVKNDAKSALDAAAKTSADLGGDEIPF